MTAKHHSDLIICMKNPGRSVGKLCEKCDGRCIICDSYIRPTALVRICDKCDYGHLSNKCIVCGDTGVSDAYYCKTCCILEKDREGCPRIVNVGNYKKEYIFEKKKGSKYMSIVCEKLPKALKPYETFKYYSGKNELIDC